MLSFWDLLIVMVNLNLEEQFIKYVNYPFSKFVTSFEVINYPINALRTFYRICDFQVTSILTKSQLGHINLQFFL